MMSLLSGQAVTSYEHGDEYEAMHKERKLSDYTRYTSLVQVSNGRYDIDANTINFADKYGQWQLSHGVL